MQEVFEKIIEQFEERTDFLSDCTKYGNKDAKQQEKSYSTMFMYEVADLIDDLIETVKQAAAEYNNGWIPVSERLPEEIGWYLVSRNDGIVTTGYFFEDMTWREARGVENIAWQPLPEPYQPKGE